MTKKKQKKILVQDILNIMDDTDKVCVILYAYGCYYADTQRDGMFTVKECKDQMNYDCINALVTRIRTNHEYDEDAHVVIQAEVVH
jgi:hypothetical protein